jgi:uncharacterized membrane protein required for colicin V production
MLAGRFYNRGGEMAFLPSWLNPFDVLIIFTLLVGIALGFIRGLVRMALSLLILYIAMVVAITFYVPVGTWIAYLTGGILPRSNNQALAFVAILILTTSVFNFVVHRVFKDTELPGIRQIDQLGGMILGFILICTWIGLVIVALAFVLGATDTAIGSVRDNMLMYFETSFLIPIFYRFLPIVVATLTPWMPKGLPPEIFALRLF